MVDVDRPCPHEDFAAAVEVSRLMDGDNGRPDITVGFTTEITVRCAQCDEPFTWVGSYRVGMMPTEPCIDLTAQTLRAPIRPRSSEPSFGLGLPGFLVRMNGEDMGTPLPPPFDVAGTDDHGIVRRLP